MRDLHASAGAQSDPAAAHVQGRPLTRCLGLSAPIFIPAVFLATWLMILLR